MKNGNDIVLELLTPIEPRRTEPEEMHFVLFGECNVGDCKSCPQVAQGLFNIGLLLCSCDCHHSDTARHKAGVA